MFRSSKIFIIVICLIFLPKLAQGRSFSFDQKTWEVTPQFTADTQSAFIRNDFDLIKLSQHILLDKPVIHDIQVFDADTLKQLSDISEAINQPAVSAKLKLDGNKATEFVPHQDGQALDLYQFAKEISDSQISDSAALPVMTARPAVTLGDLNSLGINELVAVGVSDFSGSSRNRIINVTVGSSKYDGVIVQPGEEFSFNALLGDVDAAHGFKPEQVIKASGIELEFGGGLCQVSTTMFRAAMNAGLPITQRRNHSFAVHYYYPQGTDATIYPGVSDLKYINDYSTPILIHTYVKAPNVYFEIYGTKDNRVVTFEGPVQYDKQPNGAMKAIWTRHVTKDGQTVDYVVKSNYVSPNLYKKVEQASTPNPQTAISTPSVPPTGTTTPTNQ